MNRPGTDAFLSEEDLDLQNLGDEELTSVYEAWLIAASATDEEDQHLYSHGVFLVEPGFQHLVPEYARLHSTPISNPEFKIQNFHPPCPPTI